MSRTNYFLLCENIVTDENNKVTLVNTFDEIIVDDLPVFCGKIVVALDISFSAEELKKDDVVFKIEVLNPKQKLILSATGKGKKGKTKKNARIISHVDLTGALKLGYEGTYTVGLFFEGQKLAATKFEVLLEKKSNQQKDET